MSTLLKTLGAGALLAIASVSAFAHGQPDFRGAPSQRIDQRQAQQQAQIRQGLVSHRLTFAEARRLDAEIQTALRHLPPGAARASYRDAMIGDRTAARDIQAGQVQAAGGALERAADRHAPGLHQRMPSGAGHDAQQLARVMPAAMLFVPSIGGRSHCPDEHTDWRDVTNGANVLLNTLVELATARLG